MKKRQFLSTPLWSCESSFSFVNDLDVFVRPKKHNMHLENEFRYTFEEKKIIFWNCCGHFFLQNCCKILSRYIEKHRLFRSKI